MWAQRELPRMGPALLEEFTVVLDEENPELFKWLTGQAQPSEAMAGNRAFQVGRQPPPRAPMPPARPRGALPPLAGC